MFSKSNKFNSLILNNNKEVFFIKDDDNEKFNYGTLTCRGGASFHKGISIGMQDKMVNGLIIYDEENFFGYSDKNGLILLSLNNDFKELEMPLFDSNLEKKEKTLNIDLTFRDIINYYINIPNSIDLYDISLIFNIKFIYDDESLVNQINFHIINNNKKDVKFNILNDNIYYSSNKFKKNGNSIIKFNLNQIDLDHIICNIDKFSK
tara:strand:+ start:847 stop:1464 length:618 start_codon:yes stop_codon:yes gene_type:complete